MSSTDRRKVSEKMITARWGSGLRFKVAIGHKERILASLQIGKEYRLWSEVYLGEVNTREKTVFIFATAKWIDKTLENVYLIKDCFDGFVERLDVLDPDFYRKNKGDGK